MAPMSAPASTQASSSAMSFPPRGTECRKKKAATPTASTGMARERSVERVLADLADDQEDEDGVDQVHVDVVHADSVPPAPVRGVGPRVGLAG